LPLLQRYPTVSLELSRFIDQLYRLGGERTVSIPQCGWDYLRPLVLLSQQRGDFFEKCILYPYIGKFRYSEEVPSGFSIPAEFYAPGMEGVLQNCLSALYAKARHVPGFSKASFIGLLTGAPDSIFNHFAETEAAAWLVHNPSCIRTMAHWNAVKGTMKVKPQRFYLNARMDLELVLHWINALNYQPEVKFFVYWAKNNRWDVIQATMRYARPALQPNIQRLLDIASPNLA
jgi:hypothetical protein